jgi:hypothetical protein
MRRQHEESSGGVGAGAGAPRGWRDPDTDSLTATITAHGGGIVPLVVKEWTFTVGPQPEPFKIQSEIDNNFGIFNWKDKEGKYGDKAPGEQNNNSAGYPKWFFRLYKSHRYYIRGAFVLVP